MRKKILVDIYLAFNLGDDMFLDFLAQKYPNYDFVPLHPGKNYKEFIVQYPNVELFPYNLFDKFLARMGRDKLKDFNWMSNQYDGLLFLGGGIFREESYWEEVYNYRKNIVSFFKKKSKNIWFMGCNFGPFTSNQFKIKYENIFSECSKVNFRDKKSYDLFSSLKNVGYYPDILWGYKLPKTKKNEKTLGISLINPNHKDGGAQYFDNYVKSHVRLIENYLKKGYKIRLFSFCEAEGDLIIANLISKYFLNNVEIVFYKGNIKAFLISFGECSKVIAARFHANIIAIKYKIPLIPVVYSDKTSNFLNDIGYENKKIKLNNINQLEEVDATVFDQNLIDSIIEESNRHLHF